MKKNQNYEINFATKTITVTKKFLQEASQMGTSAFTQMLQLQDLGMTICVKEVNRTKPAEDKWSYKEMERYLEKVSDSDKWMADYNTLKSATSHPVVWNWFKTTFPVRDSKGKRVVPKLDENHNIIVGPWTKTSQDNVNALVASHSEAKEEKKQALIETAPQKIGA